MNFMHVALPVFFFVIHNPAQMKTQKLPPSVISLLPVSFKLFLHRLILIGLNRDGVSIYFSIPRAKFEYKINITLVKSHWEENNCIL